MMDDKLSRREMIRRSGLAALSGSLAGMLFTTTKSNATMAMPMPAMKELPFRISLNTSTIQGYRLPVEKQIDLCAEAGFKGIELWIRDVEAYARQGGSPESLARQMQGAGLVLENMIGFSAWIADEPDKRAEGLQVMRRDMELTARLGGKCIAAPVQGIRSVEREKLPEYAARFRHILEIGDQVGVTPILELWGAGALNQLSDAVAIAVATGHPKATLLLDFYHLYRGGNSFDSLRLLNGAALPVFHINDYPAQPERAALKDSDRVFPGDGICPFRETLPVLYQSGFRGALSVELFNKGYWETMDVKTVLQKSYEQTVRVVSDSL